MHNTPQDEPGRRADEHEDSYGNPSEKDALQYLDEVLSNSDSSEGSLPTGAQAILVTSKKFPNASITDPLVAEALIAELLRDHWGSLELHSDQAIELHQVVSQALLDDPTARQRLLNLWDRVVGIDGK